MDEWQQVWSDEAGIRAAREMFTHTYGASPHGVWAAPGRINLIGEHTDYNGGLCLPMALPHRTYVAVSRREDGAVRMRSGFESAYGWEGELADLVPGVVSGWVAYCGGPAWAMRQDGIDVPGFDLAIASCVPAGAGLSSSAAVECAVGLALADLAGEPLDVGDANRARLARLCVRAENEMAGAPTGGMDQSVSLRARAGHALLLDCLEGSAEHIPLDLAAVGLDLLVIDTRAPHTLVDGQYAARRASCEEAARVLGVATLRETADGDEPLDSVLARFTGSPDCAVLRRRVRHVVTEIRRVRQFVAAVNADDWEQAGRLMNASHASLRDDYEVSCIELDTAVHAAQRAGALGARLIGGGFGGSAIALVRAERADEVAGAVVRAALDAHLSRPALHRATPSAAGERLA